MTTGGVSQKHHVVENIGEIFTNFLGDFLKFFEFFNDFSTLKLISTIISLI